MKKTVGILLLVAIGAFAISCNNNNMMSSDNTETEIVKETNAEKTNAMNGQTTRPNGVI